MIRLGVIGAGTVFRHQIGALSAMPEAYKVVAVCDTNPKRLAEVPALVEPPLLCASITQLLSCQIDAVLISTPPKTHFDLSMQCLAAGKDVLLEKPAVCSMHELEQLYHKAQDCGALLHVAYHAAFAADLAWFLANKEEVENRYGLKDLAKIYCGFYDPYIQNGVLSDKKADLLGSFIDSGINALSVCARLVALEEFSTLSHRCQADKSGTVIASHTRLKSPTTTLCIDTGWIYGLNRKKTVLQYEDADRQIVLDHSNQRVLLGRTMTEDCILRAFHEKKDAEPVSVVLFENTREDRLRRHYMGVFADFESAVLQRASNEKSTRVLHRLLCTG